MLNRLIATKQLSIYLILTSLMLTAALMRPSVAVLIGIPINAAILCALRWAAHREGEQFW